jgi:hypothetical protein
VREAQAIMFDELPQDNLEAVKKKKKTNCLQEMIIELMNERKLTDAEVVKATSIPWGTWSGWVNGDVNCQLADDNLKRLMQFFNVHLEFLVYGIGDGEPAFGGFEDEST